MNKILIIIILIVAPSLAFSQSNTSIDTTKKIETMPTQKEIVIKKAEIINIDVKAVEFDYKKSKDITSVKAYIRSLQLKRKETLVS